MMIYKSIKAISRNYFKSEVPPPVLDNTLLVHFFASFNMVFCANMHSHTLTDKNFHPSYDSRIYIEDIENILLSALIGVSCNHDYMPEASRR